MIEWQRLKTWMDNKTRFAIDRLGNFKKGIIPYIKKHNKTFILSSSLALVVLAGSGTVFGYYNSQIQTIYHVFVDGDEVGIVNEPDVVTSWISQLKEKNKKRYGGVEIKIPDDIDFRKEDKYKGQWDNQEVLSVLKDKIDIKAKAVKLTIDGEFIGYVKNDQQVQHIFKDIQSEYIEKEESNKKIAKVSTASFSSVENRKINEVEIKEDVDVESVIVSPDQIVSGEQVENLLKKGTLEEIQYSIVKGDYLGIIANKYDLSTKELLRNNPGLTEDTILQIGQKINVTAYEPKVTVRVEELVKKKEEIDYDYEVRKDPSMYAGETKVLQNGKEGNKEVTYEIVKENGIEISRNVINEKVLKKPVVKILAKGTKVVPSRGTGSFRWPLHQKGIITSGFGWRWGRMHEGVDISGVSNRTILAADNGKVVLAGWDGGYGNCILIDHNNGYKTRYGHLSKINVRVGQTIAKGQAIGVMGSTGNSTGLHLHFEIIVHGQPVNPLKYF